MYLSDEQNAAVRHGLNPSPTWSWVTLPVGPQPLPAWAKGLHIRTWYIHYGNPPDFVLKCDTDLRRWEGQTYTIEGDRYMAAHPDGRADIYYHSGPVVARKLKRWVMPRPGEEGGHEEEYEALATPQQEGFGGSHYSLLIAGGPHDGKTVVLRGPWHGPSPKGYLGAAYVDVGATWRNGYRDKRPWHKWTPMGGLYITYDLFALLVARFQPHLRVALVKTGARERLELVRPDWRCPKSCMTNEERRAQQKAEPRQYA